MINFLAIGSSIFLYGIITLLNYFRFAHLNQEEVFSIVLIFYGLVTFVKSFHKLKRGGLFLTSIFMNIGIVLFVLTNFEILNWYDIVTPSILYIVAAGFVTLYIENTAENILLITAALFFVLSLLSVLFAEVGFIYLMHSIALILFDFWPLFFILFGLMLIMKKPHIESSAGSTVTNTAE